MSDASLRHGPAEAGGASLPVDRRAAFAMLTDEHLSSAYRLAGVILGDPIEGQDATHDAVVAAWRSYGSLRDPARFEAWFGRILVNVCRSRLRRRRKGTIVDLDDGRDVAAGDPIGRVDDRIAFDRAFERLSPDQRVAVAMRYWADLTVDDIAERVGVPAGTIKSRLHSAIERLHDVLGESTEAVR